MKKRNMKSLRLQKITISNFLVGGLAIDSDHACETAVSCDTVCFCIPEGLTDHCFVAAPKQTQQRCEVPSNSVSDVPVEASGPATH